MANYGSLGPPTNIDKWLGKSKGRVNRVGIELEGGWNKILSGITRDGSVRFSDEIVCVANLRAIGELPSPPIEVGMIPTWMKTHYPAKVNESCGMHVHMSFRTSLSYQRLMVTSYPATVVEYFKQWATAEGFEKGHPIWARLAGKSEYCQLLFQADDQVRVTTKDYDHHRKGHRYTVIGYPHGRYRTVECRLLPMMETYEQGVRAVQYVVDITNAFLATTAKRELKIKISPIVDDEHTREERRIHV